MKSLHKDFSYYVYVLLDPTKKGNYTFSLGARTWKFRYEPFYVGKGRGRRVFESARLSSSSNTDHKNRRIAKIHRSGSHVRPVVLLRHLTNLSAYRKEQVLIRTIGRRIDKAGPLVNFTDGGPGVSGLVHSRLSRKKMSSTKLGRPKELVEAQVSRYLTTMREKTEEQKIEMSRRQSKAQKKVHKSRSIADWEKRNKNFAKKVSETYNKKSESEKRAIADKIRQKRLAFCARQTPEYWKAIYEKKMKTLEAKKRALI